MTPTEKLKQFNDAIKAIEQTMPKHKPLPWYRKIDAIEWSVLAFVGIPLACLCIILIVLTILFIAGAIWLIGWMF